MRPGGNFGDRRTRRELSGIGGSVAGCANVTDEGEESTVRAEGVNAIS